MSVKTVNDTRLKDLVAETYTSPYELRDNARKEVEKAKAKVDKLIDAYVKSDNPAEHSDLALLLALPEYKSVYKMHEEYLIEEEDVKTDFVDKYCWLDIKQIPFDKSDDRDCILYHKGIAVHDLENKRSYLVDPSSCLNYINKSNSEIDYYAWTNIACIVKPCKDGEAEVSAVYLPIRANDEKEKAEKIKDNIISQVGEDSTVIFFKKIEDDEEHTDTYIMSCSEIHNPSNQEKKNCYENILIDIFEELDTAYDNKRCLVPYHLYGNGIEKVGMEKEQNQEEIDGRDDI